MTHPDPNPGSARPDPNPGSARPDPLQRARRTRAGMIWVALAVALVFLVLLIVFIAQNSQSVQINFFAAHGRFPLALALLVAAVAGAVVLLLAGAVRILQLRLAARAHRRAAGH